MTMLATMPTPGVESTRWLRTVADEPRWHVLHTRSRMEKALVESLDALQAETYLPLLTEVRTYGRRRLTVHKPLFPGYVFLLGTLEQAYAADRTRRVANVIAVPDQARLAWELQNIRRALEQRGDLQIDPYPYLKQGVRVVVRSGPLAGLEGIIQDRTRRDRIVLTVQTLGRAVAMETDGALLDPLD